MAKLVVLTEGYVGRNFELKSERTTIGRLEDNAFPIPEPSVSSHHCEIIWRGTEVLVKDLNSTNGTFIDGNAVTEAPLKPGQILRLGQVELRLDDGSSAAAPPARKRLDQTQGVKMNELGGTQTVKLGADSPFKKKSDKINRLFVTVGVGLAVLVIGLLLWAILRSSS
jgi:pSer/pThr/pTyr-binding forkhead associated (FHA) protein